MLDSNHNSLFIPLVSFTPRRSQHGQKCNYITCSFNISEGNGLQLFCRNEGGNREVNWGETLQVSVPIIPQPTGNNKEICVLIALPLRLCLKNAPWKQMVHDGYSILC